MSITIRGERVKKVFTRLLTIFYSDLAAAPNFSRM